MSESEHRPLDVAELVLDVAKLVVQLNAIDEMISHLRQKRAKLKRLGNAAIDELNRLSDKEIEQLLANEP
jgi:hypothetical protein